MPALKSGLSARKQRSSKTAILAACVRAYHSQQSMAPVFSDDYAVAMVPFFWRVIAKNRLLGWFVTHKVFHSFRRQVGPICGSPGGADVVRIYTRGIK